MKTFIYICLLVIGLVLPAGAQVPWQRMVATRFRIHGDDDPVKTTQLRHTRPLPRRRAPPSRGEEDLANVVWAKAGSFASLGTADRRAFALARFS